jgi:hypothetical protein
MQDGGRVHGNGFLRAPASQYPLPGLGGLLPARFVRSKYDGTQGQETDVRGKQIAYQKSCSCSNHSLDISAPLEGFGSIFGAFRFKLASLSSVRTILGNSNLWTKLRSICHRSRARDLALLDSTEDFRQLLTVSCNSLSDSSAFEPTCDESKGSRVLACDNIVVKVAAMLVMKTE